jgi:hypothetical protein
VSSKAENRRHWVSLSLASWSPKDQEDPIWIAAGRELDGLEEARGLSLIDAARRDWLRSQRAVGAIADAGEPWPPVASWGAAMLLAAE